jgi:hypothetical protein
MLAPSRETGAWFANRMVAKGFRSVFLLTGFADKKYIHGYVTFQNRNESEIVVFPEHVRYKRVLK